MTFRNCAVITALFALLVCSMPAAMGQTPAPSPVPSDPAVYPSNFAAIGVAYNAFATPNINGWATYAKNLGFSASMPTFSLTSWDVTSQQLKPFIAQTSVRTGLAQVLLRRGPLTALALMDVGIAAASNDVGVAGSGGGILTADLGEKLAHVHLVFAARALKTSISDRQYVYEIGFGKAF